MQQYVHSGYYSIYRPPFSSTSPNTKSTIFCVSDRFNTALVIIPLVPSFYNDVIEIVKKHPARNIYLVATDIGIVFASDFYLSWEMITKKLRKDCTIFSKYMVENYTRADFKSAILRTKNDNLSINIPRSDLDEGVIDITLTKNYVSTAAPFSCDLILNDTMKKYLFVGEMNIHKAEYLNSNLDEYDEIHMPYITGNYHGMTYNETLKKFPKLVNKLLCNQFASYEEYQCAKSLGVKVGGAFKYDSVQTRICK